MCVLARPGRFQGEVVHWYEESDTYDVLYSGVNFFFFGMKKQTPATCYTKVLFFGVRIDTVLVHVHTCARRHLHTCTLTRVLRWSCLV